jgi:hypothetical protein
MALDLGYTDASFQGQYGFSIIFGQRAAVGAGIAISDGNGNFHGIQNLNTEGQHIPFTYEGTYQVSPDGTGTAHVKLKAPDGTVTEADFDYVVLQAINVGTFKLGTEWQGLTRQPTNGIYGVSWFKSIP